MKLKILFFVIIIVFFLISIFIFFQKADEDKNPEVILKPEIIQQTESKKINGDSLLVQVNKQYCLPQDYVPSGLVHISEYGIPETKDFLLRKIVMPDLEAMVDQAKQDGVELRIISAYRSYQNQIETYNYWVDQLGLEEASRQSALPGCSQHQLGTAVDFNELEFSFTYTSAGIWLSKNAWQYGWVISFPLNSESITGYAYEPWHYRYIGKDNALKMQKSGLILSKFLEENN